MALVLSDQYISAFDLTAYTRTTLSDLPQNQFTLNRFLPDISVDDIDFRARTGGSGLTEVAEYRSYDAESPIAGREGQTIISGELPPISRKTRLGEYDRLKMRGQTDAIISGLQDDAVTLAKAIRARAEVARGELLQTGKVSIEGNGLTGLKADFGRKASHTQTAATLWNADGDVIDHLLALRKIYSDTNGVAPGVMLWSPEVIAAAMRSAKVSAQVYGKTNEGRLVTLADLNSLLVSFGLPTVTEYTAQVKGANGPKSVLDPSRILFLPDASQAVGETLWGTTAEALDPGYQISGSDAPGIVAGAYSDQDPVAQWTKVSAIMLPVAPNTDLTLSSKVI